MTDHNPKHSFGLHTMSIFDIRLFQKYKVFCFTGFGRKTVCSVKSLLDHIRTTTYFIFHKRNIIPLDIFHSAECSLGEKLCNQMEGPFEIPDRTCDAQVEALLEFGGTPINRRELYERAFAFWQDGRYTKAGSFMAKNKIDDVSAEDLLRIEVTEGVPILFGLINYVFTIKSEVLKPKTYEAESLEFHIRAINIPMTKRFVSKFTITPVEGQENNYQMRVRLWIKTAAWAKPFAYAKTVNGWTLSHTKCMAEMKQALLSEMNPSS